MEDTIKEIVDESIKVHQLSYDLIENIKKAVEIIINSLKNGKKILVCGNGGSAAEAQHFSSELIGKFEKDRKSLASIALTTDSSILTAVGNDLGYEYVFSRQIEALGNENDVLVCLTSSDYDEKDKHSLNLKNAIMKAKEKNMNTILIGSVKSKKIGEIVDAAIKVNNQRTARIQEVHLLIIHILTKIIEDNL